VQPLNYNKANNQKESSSVMAQRGVAEQPAGIVGPPNAAQTS